MITIKVPATSANMGPGFDSLGMAVNLYLELTVVGPANTWVIEHDFDYLPHDERNLIIKIAKKVSPTIRPYHLVMTTNIPTTRGLGSSSSAIIAGIELANYANQLQLSLDEKIKLATKFEGHPDNVVPALTGHMVASAYTDNHVYWSKIKLHRLAAVACIPKKPLSTKESRGVLPNTMSLAQAAQASAISNVLLAQLTRGFYRNIKKIIEKDKFHEPYRQHLVPELLDIRRLLKRENTYGTYLSGAGPTVMTLVPEYQQKNIQKILEKAYPQYDIVPLKIDRKGTVVIEHD